jgi:NAD(P)-dependent dehydrogenase (short-subunit alcohol dehydrogenase family)
VKTALITGANRGIGLEFCRQYAAEGWRILACSRYPEKSDALNKLAAGNPELIKVHALDVADHVEIDRLGQILADESIDLLINNAGIYPDSDKSGFGHTDYAEWIEAFRINTMAPLKMAETFAAQIGRGRQKTIVTITSKMGSIADNSGGGSYRSCIPSRLGENGYGRTERNDLRGAKRIRHTASDKRTFAGRFREIFRL